MADDTPVPVWGIEAGGDRIRAIRLAPGEDGGFRVLDYREDAAQGPGPEAVVSFLRRRGLKRHPVAVAMVSPTAWFRSVQISEDELARPRDDMAACLGEYIPPEPEEVDFRWTVTGDNLYLVSAEIRARVESYMIALESAQVYTYGLLGGSQALHAGIHRSGLDGGDGIVLRIHGNWTDVLFLDDGHAARQALPAGRAHLASDAGRASFATDVGRLVEYHRTRVERKEPERIFIIGVDAETALSLGEALLGETANFPSDAANVRGGSGMSLVKALDACRAAPAAVGAALTAVAVPRNEELSLRTLPTVLPKPPAGDRTWYAASILLWVALLVAWFALSRERDRLSEVVSRDAPEAPGISEVDADALAELSGLAELRLAFPRAAARALAAVPGPEATPFRTELLSLSAEADGSYRVTLHLLLIDAGEDPKAPRVEGARRRFLAATDQPPVLVGSEGDFRVRGSFRAGGSE